MKCDVCGKQFNNADELKLHMEQAHPMNEGETPDMKDENPEVKREEEVPEVETPMPVKRTS